MFFPIPLFLPPLPLAVCVLPSPYRIRACSITRPSLLVASLPRAAVLSLGCALVPRWVSAKRPTQNESPPTNRLVFLGGIGQRKPQHNTTGGLHCNRIVVSSCQTFDNPAVQLRGPFLWDRLIPPPAHRNVVMIAAGTGVNPSERLASGTSMLLFTNCVFRDGQVRLVQRYRDLGRQEGLLPDDYISFCIVKYPPHPYRPATTLWLPPLCRFVGLLPLGM